MPRTGGLLSSAHRSAAGNTRPSSRGNQASAELPPYETPSCPIDESAKRALSELSNTCVSTRAYGKNLAQSAKYLATSIGQVNDRVQRRRAAVRTAAERRQKKGHARTAQDGKNEEALAELENVAPGLTISLEASMRQVIDRKADLEDEKELFREVSRLVTDRAPPVPRNPQQQRRRRRRGQAESDSEAEGQVDAEGDVEMKDGDGEEQEEHVDLPIPGTIHLLEQVRASKRSAYESLSVEERYSRNNDYIAFKRTWHDALHLDDDIPLPDPAQWFDEDGNPVADAEGAEHGEDELVVAREVLSLKCPLSLKVMEEPYGSNKCKHTFEKEAILEFLRQGPKQCPQTGCSAKLCKKDMFFDEIMLRRIERAADRQARRDAMDATSDVEPDHDEHEGSELRVVSRNVKKQSRASIYSLQRIDGDIEDDEV